MCRLWCFKEESFSHSQALDTPQERILQVEITFSSMNIVSIQCYSPSCNSQLPLWLFQGASVDIVRQICTKKLRLTGEKLVGGTQQVCGRSEMKNATLLVQWCLFQLTRMSLSFYEVLCPRQEHVFWKISSCNIRCTQKNAHKCASGIHFSNWTCPCK